MEFMESRGKVDGKVTSSWLYSGGGGGRGEGREVF